MPTPAHRSAGSAAENDDLRASERSAIAEARDSLRDGRVLSGAEAEIWLNAWERGEEPPIPSFDLASDAV